MLKNVKFLKRKTVSHESLLSRKNTQELARRNKRETLFRKREGEDVAPQAREVYTLGFNYREGKSILQSPVRKTVKRVL
jgi:hypothetical protein